MSWFHFYTISSSLFYQSQYIQALSLVSRLREYLRRVPGVVIGSATRSIDLYNPDIQGVVTSGIFSYFL
jgi:hypothetical protein